MFSVYICLLEFPSILCFTLLSGPVLPHYLSPLVTPLLQNRTQICFMKPSLILLVKCNPLHFELDTFLQKFYTINSSTSVCVLVTQSCPTLWDPMNCSPWGSSVHGILRQEYWSGLPLPSPGKFFYKFYKIYIYIYIFFFFLISKIFLGHLS